MILTRRGVTVGGTLAPHIPGPVFAVRVAVRGVPLAAGLIAQQIAIIPSRKVRDDLRDSEAMIIFPGESPLFVLDEPADYIRFEAPAGGLAVVDITYGTSPRDSALPAPAEARRGLVLFDSTVAAGALIDTGVMDLTGFSELEAIVDNTQGTTFRDLTFTPYDGILPGPGALVESLVPLRRCGFGTAPFGSSYAPGNVRGYIGPNPPGGTPGTHVLFDGTSGSNAAISTPGAGVFVEDMDGVVVFGLYSGSPVSGNLTVAELGDDGVATNALCGYAGNAQATHACNIGPGASTISTIATSSFAGVPMVRRITATLAAAGSALTGRLRILGRGRVPGTFAHQIALPPKARVQLAAAGAGTARLAIVGR